MMKGIVLFVLVFCLLTSKVLSASYTDVTVSDAKNMIDSEPSIVVLDVRTQSDYDAGHIKNARLIPVDELEQRLNELNKTQRILVYCRSGHGSSTASQILVNNGFLHVYNMLEGITAWINAGNPVYVKYPSIQEAINNATEGSSFFVSAGTYYGHLVINKTVSIIGENEYITILDGNYTGNVLNITASDATITRFTVRNSGSAELNSGIYINGKAGNSVTDSVVESNYVGILVFNSTCCNLSRNTVFQNNDDGIRLKFCGNVTVANNAVFSNRFYGINLHDSNENMISGNVGSNNTYGFCCDRNSNNNTIHENSFLSNGNFGIGISWYSDNNTVSGNTVSGNYVGVDLDWGSTNNSVLGNSIFDNTYGMWLSRARSNLLFHNNFVGNAREAFTFDSAIICDNGLEGNYWSRYTAFDFNQDGIGDTPYSPAPNCTDNRPIMGRFYSFSVPSGYVDVISNSTINDFQFLEPSRTIKMHASSITASQAFGFCRIRIPHALMNQTYRITIDGADPHFANYALHDDGESRWIYFSYMHSALEIVITPEFQSLILLLTFMTTTLVTCLVHRRRFALSQARWLPKL
jgi:parallel beta-helix repeat protein